MTLGADADGLVEQLLGRVTFVSDRRALDDLGHVGIEQVAGKHAVPLGVDDPIRVHSPRPNKMLFVGSKRAL